MRHKKTGCSTDRPGWLNTQFSVIECVASSSILTQVHSFFKSRTRRRVERFQCCLHVKDPFLHCKMLRSGNIPRLIVLELIDRHSITQSLHLTALPKKLVITMKSFSHLILVKSVCYKVTIVLRSTASKSGFSLSPLPLSLSLLPTQMVANMASCTNKSDILIATWVITTCHLIRVWKHVGNVRHSIKTSSQHHHLQRGI